MTWLRLPASLRPGAATFFNGFIWSDVDDCTAFESYSKRVAELGDIERTLTYNKGCPINAFSLAIQPCSVDDLFNPFYVRYRAKL